MLLRSAPKLRRRSAFEFWLRTGRHIDAPYLLVDIETKFNQRHYTENGQFARTGEGVLYGPGFGGFGGGGGGASGKWDGGGASGSWEDPEKPKPRSAPKPVPTPTPASIARQPGTAAVPQVRQTIIRNSYRFTVDTERRTYEVTGQLHIASNPVRSRRVQRQAGGSDRQASDDGGHFIAARFNGPREWFNHFAQDGSFNRRDYRKLENEWARRIIRGEKVNVAIKAFYKGDSKRPSEIRVRWTSGGSIHRHKFPNGQGGR
jgi:DNA/RNA non-specific endonuclease